MSGVGEDLHLTVRLDHVAALELRSASAELDQDNNKVYDAVMPDYLRFPANA
jgi:hypothetical protein